MKLALSDFQASSKELEDEMEKELANTERRETELRTEAERLRGEVDSWKVRHQNRPGYRSDGITHRLGTRLRSKTIQALLHTCRKSWKA